MRLPPNLRRRVEDSLRSYWGRKDQECAAHGMMHRVRLRGESVTIMRSEPVLPGLPGSVDLPLAQLRYDPTARRWRLYCPDRNARWHPYILSDPALDFQELLQIIDEDATGVFRSCTS